MCGRYTLTVDPAELREMLELGELPPDLHPRYNIAPMQPVPVVTSAQERKVEMYQWGLIPSWSKDPSMASRMINARAESLAEKPAYRVPYQRKRCLVLADGFIEWKAEGSSKQPYFIQLTSRAPFAFAGLWDLWTTQDGKEKRTCTIITCTPNDFMATLHNRMPVILDKAAMWDWIDPAASPVALRALLVPYAGTLTARPVSKLVNKPAYDAPDALQPERNNG
jgi:putative SOS response-associated peptidase YedK